MKLPQALQTQKQSACALLRECIASASLAQADIAHDRIHTWELEQDTLVGNLLVQMHGTLGSLDQAITSFNNVKERNVFSWTILLAAFARHGHLELAEAILDKMPQRNTVSWNSLISSYARCGDQTKALFLYRRMDQAGEKPNHMTMLAVVEACSGVGTIEQRNFVQERVVDSGFLCENEMLGNSLVSMHGKSGSVEQALFAFESLLAERDMVSWNAILAACAQNGCLIDAKAFFDNMPGRGIVSWNSMMTAFARNGREEDAVLLFAEMESLGVDPTQASFVIALDACAARCLLQQGRQIHRSAGRRGFGRDAVVGALLVNMYGKCRSLPEAEEAFSLLDEPSLVAWNSMLSAIAVQQETSTRSIKPDCYSPIALELLRKMDSEGCQADEITIASFANACRDLFIAKLVFSSIETIQLLADSVFVNTAFITAFARSGSLRDAAEVFESIPGRTAVSWNAMLSVLVQNGATLEALELFRNMDLDGVSASAVTIITMLEICPEHQHLRLGEEIHSAARSNNLESDPIVSSALISMYGKSKKLEEAKMVYDKVRDQPSTTMASRTAMLTALAQNGDLKQAEAIFETTSERNIATWNAMISAYAQSGDDEKAVSTFLDMLVDGIAPDNVTFTVLLGSCSVLPLDLVKLLHSAMVNEDDLAVDLDEFAASALVKSYGKCGDFANAIAVFYDLLPGDDPASWNVVMAACAQNGDPWESLAFFRRMLVDGVRPNLITFATALDACSALAQVNLATLLHAMILESGLDGGEIVSNALVNLYGKCGSSRSALEVFSCIPPHQRSVVSWTSIITAVSETGGDPAQAVGFFQAMNLEGAVPDGVTFMSVLSSLSHAGEFDTCMSCFLSIQADFAVAATAEHYACMVNLLGRTGELSKAEELIRNMPYEPGYLEWMMLLGASGIHSSSSCGRRAADNVLMIDQQAAAVPYVLLSNLFVAAG